MDSFIHSLHSTDEEIILNTCDSLAHSAFIPWLNKQNQANKLYFAKKGGISLCVKWMREAKFVDTKAAAGTAVWNFSEAGIQRIRSHPFTTRLHLLTSVFTYRLVSDVEGPMHAILWRNGAVDALLEFLKSNQPDLQKVAVGALFGLLDYG
eukprot:TRINITY_DN4089_c0_g1_i2.p1 TRINITY_DN4089_c0_g1~~TRINITY_DN4089_c0_g1_i2.p1  ORF type:complete len:151 (-),score=21.76 TRINITY_DN4089_c0_g1_i2:398-850(-)